jgi:hypothetical protein
MTNVQSLPAGTVAPAQSETPATPPAQAPSGLDQLRDILVGDQTRTHERRLTDAEKTLAELRQTLTVQLQEGSAAQADSFATQLAAARRELAERTDRQATEHAVQLRALQKEWGDRFERQSTEQGSQLRAVQRELRESQDQQTVELMTQLRALQRDLTEKIDGLASEYGERIRTLQTESRQRDDSLRQDLLALAAMLEEKKTSRQTLSQLLMELAQRL